MLFRAGLLVVVFGAMGCISLRDATLISARVSVETFNAPVKCGPVGFRRVPLESRFGEYVRVTVSAPVSLKGTAFIHADGVAQEPREWVSTAENPLVIEARFENGDPDTLVALNADRPIDITITGLEAPEGGSCEGAVFTLEHGRLVAPVDDRAWLAELERRGGPELLARREAARQLEEERRLAHYAEWKAQSATDEELALMEARRLAHYAAWEAERRPVEADSETAIAAAEEWNEFAPGQVVGQSAVTAAACASGVCEAGVAPVGGEAVVGRGGSASAMVPGTACAGGLCGSETAALGRDGAVGAMSPGAACASGACGGETAAVGISVNSNATSSGAACASGVCGGEAAVGLGGSVNAMSPGAACASGACGGETAAVGLGGSVSAMSPCASGACGGESAAVGLGGSVSAMSPGAACASGVCGGEAAVGLGGSVSAMSPGAACASGACGGAAVAVGLDFSNFDVAAAPAGCTTSACAVPAAACKSGGCAPAHGVCVGSACSVSATCHSGSCLGAAIACGSSAGAGAHVEFSAPSTWSAYPPSSGGGGNIAAGGVAGNAEEWALPQTTDVSWQQPFETVAIETQVAVPERERLRPGLVPVPPSGPCASCGADVEIDVGFIPAMFDLMFGLATPLVAPLPARPAQRPHGAVPVSPTAPRR